MIFETFCRIHQCISIEMLAQKLNMKPTEAERWIVNLIRQAKLDAKIDSQQGKYLTIIYCKGGIISKGIFT
jgi:translation initiation factor 3 subunit E